MTKKNSFCKWKKEHGGESVPIDGIFCQYCGRDQLVGLRLIHYIFILVVFLVGITYFVFSQLTTLDSDFVDEDDRITEPSTSNISDQTKTPHSDNEIQRTLTPTESKSQTNVSTFIQYNDLPQIEWGDYEGRVVFVSYREDTNEDDEIDLDDNGSIFILNLSNGFLRGITSPAYDDRNPAWSPDGERIAFASVRKDSNSDGKINDSDNASIFIMNVSDEEARRLTTSLVNYDNPDWSEDGQTIASRCFNDSICIIPFNGGAVSRYRYDNIEEITGGPYWFGSDQVIFVAQESSDSDNKEFISSVFSLNIQKGDFDLLQLDKQLILSANPSNSQQYIAMEILNDKYSDRIIVISDSHGNQLFQVEANIYFRFGGFDPAWLSASDNHIIFSGVFTDWNGDDKLDESDNSCMALFSKNDKEIQIFPNTGSFDREPDWIP